MGNSHSELVHTVNGGKRPGTWAHWQIAMNYARYLDPAFAAKCNVAVRERMEGQTGPSALTTDRAFKNALGGIVKRCSGVVVDEKLSAAIPLIIDGVAERIRSCGTVVALADHRPVPKQPASIADLIATHRTLVHLDEAMFDEDGQPKGDGHIASQQAVRFAFAALVAAPCHTQADVVAKVDYILNGNIGDRESLTSNLLGEDFSSLHAFLRSLLGDAGTLASRSTTAA